MIVVLPAALKHGLSKNEVAYAWEHVLAYRRRLSDLFPPHYLGLGVLPSGSMVEMVAYSTGFEWVIFHAMTPPTKNFLKEFEGA